MTAVMCKRLIAVALIAGALLALGGAAAQAQIPVRHSVYRQYIDPFAAPGWVPNRTDMGVDWLVTRPLPVLAIGNAVILGSDSHDGGWPGGHFIWYRLLNGTHAGDMIYVAEHLKHLLPAGVHVRAGMTTEMADHLLKDMHSVTAFLESLDAPLPSVAIDKRTAFAH